VVRCIVCTGYTTSKLIPLNLPDLDLTLTNSQLIDRFSGWKISEQDSISDHNIIKYNIITDRKNRITVNDQRTRPLQERYRVNKESIDKFQANITKLVATNICKQQDYHNIDDLDEIIHKQITRDTGIEKIVEDFSRELKRPAKHHSEYIEPIKYKINIKLSPGGHKN
jgi:hypothetical protein